MNGYRHLRLDVLAALALFLGAGALAEQPPVPPPIVDEPNSSVHSQITKAILAKLPKYVPPAPAKVANLFPPDNASDPADDILRLPKITVRPTTPAPAPGFAWLNEKGRLELAMKNSPGLRLGNFFGLNQGIALAMQVEEREVQAKAALTEVVERTTLDDSEGARKIRQLLQAAVQRPNTDWLTAKGGKPARP